MVMRFRVLEPAYIENAYRNVGEIVAVPDDFVPGPHLEPVDGDRSARRSKDTAVKERGEMPVPGDPEYIGRMIAHTVRGGETHGEVQVNSDKPQTPIVDKDGVVRGVRPADDKKG